MERKYGRIIIRRAAAVGFALLFLLFSVGCSVQRTPEAELKLSVKEAQIRIGGRFLFSTEEDDGTLWLSSNEAVATVDGGIVTGIAAGKATITAVRSEEHGGAMQTCAVTVSPDVQGVKSTLTDACLTVGDSITFTTNLSDRQIIWVTSEESVASVADGTVELLAMGETEITAASGANTASYRITAMEPAKAPAPPVVDPTDPTDPNPDDKDPDDKDPDDTDPDNPNPDNPDPDNPDPDNPDPDDKEPDDTEPEEPERQLIWADEFDGGTLDESKWEYQSGVQDVYVNGQTAVGPWFWGNDELQFYTRGAVSLAEGVMKITAERKDGLEHGRQFTSARITTRDRGSWTYGYFEARMKLPVGNGMWPAFWLLPQPDRGMGTNNRYGGWAMSGEIDIMEARGRVTGEVGHALHYGSNEYRSRVAKLSTPISEWHTYGLEWRSDHIAWFVDGVETFRMKAGSWTVPNGAASNSAPFDVPFYIILNLAVGGNYDGGVAPDDSFRSAAMEVDYVRVYA